MYRYAFREQALKDIKKLPKDVQIRILKKLDYFVSTDNPLQFADRLINFEIGTYRYRIGNYRVIFDLEEEVVVVITLGHCREIYR
ncbi:hypothetical protein A2188_02875 [Candidatus Woesebacteria bacterium RIFOXYA1_FULL_43_9]|uniref:Plasmid stabilization protein n=1 Tax=Candidatus Woesebacteria bacterium RIFOXYA1_FULL_43_9 TaxID=1802534 RepID=A0A1F8CKB2_9BACT|nr:MAG: hypothetical protein A2188_02875 [Candidatus Woesebacteria bacterium RIFOXYA1_FULL_43_9]